MLVDKTPAATMLQTEALDSFHMMGIHTQYGRAPVQPQPNLEALHPAPANVSFQPPPGLEFPAEDSSHVCAHMSANQADHLTFEGWLPTKMCEDVIAAAFDVASKSRSVGPEAGCNPSLSSEIPSVFDLADHPQMKPKPPTANPPSFEKYVAAHNDYMAAPDDYMAAWIWALYQAALVDWLRRKADNQSRGPSSHKNPPRHNVSFQIPTTKTKLSANAGAFVPSKHRMRVPGVPPPSPHRSSPKPMPSRPQRLVNRKITEAS